MYISYYDEAGDDGYPKYSSPIFTLTNMYVSYEDWKTVFNSIYDFRRYLRLQYNFPIKLEFHTKKFILNKIPYRNMNLSNKERIIIIEELCKFVSRLKIRVINVVINKKAIKKKDYKVLETSLKYSVQRTINDLKKIHPDKKFMIITDEGRVGKMRSITRKVQRINYIPSLFGNYSYRQDVLNLIEDPLPKNSKESYFIQISDLVSFIVYLYALNHLKAGSFHNRLPGEINEGKIKNWMKLLSGCLNLEASKENEFGVVIYPK